MPNNFTETSKQILQNQVGLSEKARSRILSEKRLPLIEKNNV